MGNAQPLTTFENLSKDTGFQVENLRTMHEKWTIKFPNGKLTQDEFLVEMCRVAGNKKFWTDCYLKLDPDSTGMITFTQFVSGVSFLKWTEQPLEVVFKMYDLKEDNVLDIDEVLNMVKSVAKSVTSDTTMEWTREFVYQLQQSGKMTKEEFVNHFLKHPGFLDACQRSLLRVLDIKEEQAEQLTAFNHQAAGHMGDILKDGSTILKRYCEREFRYYEVLKKLPKIHHFFPSYSGRTTRRNDETGIIEHYIILEDLTHGMEKPCIMDLKMGRQTCEPTAPAKKKLEQTTLDKISTSEPLGFRICGMRAYQVEKDTYIVRDKPWGMGVKVTQMESALRTFFYDGIRIREEVVASILPQLYDMLEWFKAQKIFRFYGSSILLLYDGACVEKPNVVAKMVDFAHTVRIRDGGKDDSYKFGLYTLIYMLENIISKNGTRTLQRSESIGFGGNHSQ